MADTSIPEEDKADIRPHGVPELRAQEGMGGRQRGDHSGSGSGGRQRGDHSGSGSNNRSQARGDHSDDLYNPKGDDAGASRGASSPSEIDDAETEAASLYSPDGSDRGWRRRAFFKYRKRIAIGGGIAGLGVTGFILFASVAQGPLEFVHLAQLLEKFHFASQEDAQNGRLTAIARYIHDPSKPQNTRLGIVGNIAADHLEAKINDATGLKSAYDPVTGASEGYTVIRDNPIFEGKSTDEIKQILSQKYSIDPSTITEGSDGTISLDPDPGGWNTIKRYQAQTSFSRDVLSEAGYSDLATHVGSRVLGKRAGWTFHPIKKLDASIQDAAIKGGKATYDKLKEKLKQQSDSDEAAYEAGGDTSKPGGDPSAQEETDSGGNQVPDPQGQQEADTVGDVQTESGQENPLEPDTVKTFSDNLNAKVAGGLGVGAVGLACLIRNVSSSINNERQAKIVLPMMRKAGKFISIGSQVQSGQDIDTTTLGTNMQYLDTVNSQGKVTSTWNQAKSIEAEDGDPQTGPDLPKSDQVFGSGSQSNPFDIFDGVPELGTACGALSSTLGQVFSVVTGPVNYVVSGLVLQQVIPALADWLSGAPVSPVASGADFGNLVNYGARLSANDQYASAGGVPMSSSDEVALKNVSSELDQKDFQSKSIAYRLFNTTDSETLASHLMDQQDLNVTQGISNVTATFSSIFRAAFKLPAMMISGTTHADSQTYDYHGLQAVGFTASELGDPRFDDPFKNACYVVGGCTSPSGGGILNGPDGQTYIDRAQKCFGIDISDDNGVWTTNSLTQAVDFQSTDYPASDCESQDLDWLRVRFWLLDTPTMEAYACAENLDDQSCQDLGLGGSDGSSGPGGSAGSGPTASGNAQQLAQQILSNNNIDLTSYSSSVEEDIKDAAAGKPGTAGAMTSAALLQLIATLGQNHKVMITAIQSDGQGHCNDEPESVCPTDPHYNGDAVDFGSLDGVTITGRNAPALTIIKVAEGMLPNGSAFGQQECGPALSFPPGFSDFPDTCNHLHVQVPKGTP